MGAERGRVALVSGVTGFIGSHLARGLAKRGWRVHGLVRAGSERSQLERVGARPRLHEIDAEGASLAAIVAEVAPDTVFHLASLFLVSHRPEDVQPLVRSNVLFGLELLEAAAAAGVERFVNAGTSWQHHEDRAEPVNLYAATKQAFESFLLQRTASSPMRAVTLKLFETYGPCDPRRKVLSLLVEAALSGERLAMSPGEQRLDFVHVRDVVEAFAVAADRLERRAPGSFESFALRGGAELSLRELVELFERAGAVLQVRWGGRPYREREVMRPWRGGESLPGWTATTPLAEGLGELLSEAGWTPS